MPNWCETTIAFYSPENNIENLTKVRNELQRIYDTADKPYDRLWIGDVFNRFGIEHTDYMRTHIYYIGDICENRYFIVDAEEAWGVNTEIWSKLADELELAYEFKGIEPGCCIFENSDYDKFIFDDEYYFEDEEGVNEFSDLGKLISFFNKKYDTDCVSYEEIVDNVARIMDETGQYMLIAEYEYV